LKRIEYAKGDFMTWTAAAPYGASAGLQ